MHIPVNPSFTTIGQLVPEKKPFKAFLPLYGHGSHLGHCDQHHMLMNFHFLVPKILHTN